MQLLVEYKCLYLKSKKYAKTLLFYKNWECSVFLLAATENPLAIHSTYFVSLTTSG